jgi:hypothetical protein
MEWIKLDGSFDGEAVQVVFDFSPPSIAGSVVIRLTAGAARGFGDNILEILEMWEESHTGNILPTTWVSNRLLDGGCWEGNNPSIPTVEEAVKMAKKWLKAEIDSKSQSQMTILMSLDTHPTQWMSMEKFSIVDKEIETMSRILKTIEK